MNYPAQLVHSASRYDRIKLILAQLHWLKAPERIEFNLAVLVYRCLHQTAPQYLAAEFHQSSDVEARQRFRYASSSSLVVLRTRLSTVGDRAFPVATSRLWNTLPQNVTSAPSLIILQETPQDSSLQSFLPQNPSGCLLRTEII